MKFFVTNLRLGSAYKRKHFYVEAADVNDALNKVFRKLKHHDFHVKEAIKLGGDSFYNDLETLRKKYPMVYIEAWTPEDFSMNSGDDWNRIEHIDAAAKLYDTFDANFGTNWDRVRDAAENS